ncbi:unnamed protein product [Prorocentrum cordatum]|uniref:Uncharacterized protein n=1 Tax=Prorocentrum cordatum TaxID=2364126 RepID=A0ABN9W655_9DINO|nr:unnamed protein product [Polarella glacialis]
MRREVGVGVFPGARSVSVSVKSAPRPTRSSEELASPFPDAFLAFRPQEVATPEVCAPECTNVGGAGWYIVIGPALQAVCVDLLPSSLQLFFSASSMRVVFTPAFCEFA